MIVAVGRQGAAMNIPAGLVTAYLVITSPLTVTLSDVTDSAGTPQGRRRLAP